MLQRHSLKRARLSLEFDADDVPPFYLKLETGEWYMDGHNLSNEMAIQYAYNIAGSHFRSLGMGRSVTLEAIFRF